MWHVHSQNWSNNRYGSTLYFVIFSYAVYSIASPNAIFGAKEPMFYVSGGYCLKYDDKHVTISDKRWKPMQISSQSLITGSKPQFKPELLMEHNSWR